MPHVIPTREIMLLRLTERDENCLHAFFVSSKQKCHPDRSAAKWRDLLFIIHTIGSDESAPLPFVIPTGAKRSGGICSAPLVPPESPYQTSKPKQKCHPERTRFPTSLLSLATTLWFSLKRTTCSRPKPQLSTGNPGKPRDLRFSGPILEMFFHRAPLTLRLTPTNEGPKSP